MYEAVKEMLGGNGVGHRPLAASAAGTSVHSVWKLVNGVRCVARLCGGLVVGLLNGSNTGSMTHAVVDFTECMVCPYVLGQFAGMLGGNAECHSLIVTWRQAARTLPGAISFPSVHRFPLPCAGMVATVVNDGFMTPWDVIKQRMQVHCGIALFTWPEESTT